MSCTIGSLFTGYGGLDMGVAAALGESRVAWTSDIDKGACKAIAHHHPDAPNLGDITTIDWATVEPVDVITGGSPCQDLSAAGRRAGMTAGTRSNLWVAMREAIATLRPRLVVWENVRGAYSATADSGLEHCPGCMGDPADRGPILRALGRVLGDLSDIGYNAVWHGLRAADVGAPHARLRVFVVAYPQGSPWRIEHQEPPASRVETDLLPTPVVMDAKEHHSPTSSYTSLDKLPVLLPSAVHQLLPTPTASQFPSNKSLSPGATERPALSAINQLLPTPSVADATGGHATRSGNRKHELLPMPRVENNENKQSDGWGPNFHELVHGITPWGRYSEAITHWERILGRPAPEPLTTSVKTGRPQLSALLVEWMMGLPAGHVTDIPNTSRVEQLKLLGNGVVPQQAAEAVRFALTVGAS